MLTFGEVAEAGGCRDGGQVVFSNPEQILPLAPGVEAVLLQVSWSQKGAGIKILLWKLDNLLGLDPATVHELEALQVDNLESRTHVTHAVLYSDKPVFSTTTQHYAFKHLGCSKLHPRLYTKIPWLKYTEMKPMWCYLPNALLGKHHNLPSKALYQ